jgi:hypothetical protein
LLGRIGAHRAGYAMVMFPVVALVISFFFEGLEPRLSIFAGIALVIAGNLLILKSKREIERETARETGSGDATASRNRVPNAPDGSGLPLVTERHEPVAAERS